MASNHGERVASNLRAEMARRRITQGQLAAALNISQSAAQRRVVGLTALDVNELAAAAELLGVPISTLSPDPASAAPVGGAR